MQAYIVQVSVPYGRFDRDNPPPADLPMAVAVLALTRGEALALAAEALEPRFAANNVEIRGLEIEQVYPIVEAGTTPAASVA